MPIRTTPITAALLFAALSLAACGEGLMAGGEYSGVPDTAITAGRGETNTVGQIRNDGTIILNRETGDYRPFPR